MRDWRKGDCDRRFGADGEGDMTGDSPQYRGDRGGVLPRTGLAGNTGMSRENGGLTGETGGSIWTGDSLRRANLAILCWQGREIKEEAGCKGVITVQWPRAKVLRKLQCMWCCGTSSDDKQTQETHPPCPNNAHRPTVS